MTLEQALQKVKKYNQEHILKYYEELSPENQLQLLQQIEETDMSILATCKEGDSSVEKGVITPLAAMELSEIHENYESFTKTGLEAIKEGKVGTVLLAGGMGTLFLSLTLLHI